MVRHIVLLMLLSMSAGAAQAEENPLAPVTELTKITQLSQFKALFVKSETADNSFEHLLGQIKQTAISFVTKHSDKDAVKKWHKKFKDRVETRAKDDQVNANDAADEIVMDWLVPRRNQTDWSDAEALELCNLFLYYDSKNWSLPERVQDYLKADGGKHILEILNQ